MRVSYPRYSRDELIALLHERLPALRAQLPVRRAVLFGSYARGRQTAASDVDLLVVYDDPPRDDAFALVKRTLAIRGLEPHVYAVAEYDGVRPTLERMTLDGVLIAEAQP